MNYYVKSILLLPVVLFLLPIYFAMFLVLGLVDLIWPRQEMHRDFQNYEGKQ